ncbi:unnamed protein product [Prunus brigantina]
MSFLTLRPWMRRNAIDEDGRLCGCGLNSASTPRAPAVTGARKTLAHRTVPSISPGRQLLLLVNPHVFLSAFLSLPCSCLFSFLNSFAFLYAVPGRKRGREALNTETVAAEAVPTESVVVETASSERPRKKVLLDLSEDENEEEAHSVVVSEAPPVGDEVVVEEAAAAEAMIEVVAAEVVVEEEATTEVMETLDTAEEAIEDISNDEAPAIGSPQAAQVDVALATSAEHSSVMTVPASPLPSAPPRSRGIVFRSISPPRSSLSSSATVMSMPPVPSPQESVVVTALAVVEAAATDAPCPPPVSSAVLTELEETTFPIRQPSRGGGQLGLGFLGLGFQGRHREAPGVPPLRCLPNDHGQRLCRIQVLCGCGHGDGFAGFGAAG